MKKLFRLLLIIFITFFIVSAALFSQIIYFSKQDFASQADAIVVLGAAQYAGKPSPVLKARLDHAYDLFQQKLAPIVITTGGTHPGEKFSEGEVGKKYLENRGIAAEKILAETESLTTKQNLSRVYDIAKTKNLKIIIAVSDPFHMYRATLIAKKLGLTTLSSPTKTSPISDNVFLELQFMLREMGLVVAHILFDV